MAAGSAVWVVSAIQLLVMLRHIRLYLRHRFKVGAGAAAAAGAFLNHVLTLLRRAHPAMLAAHGAWCCEVALCPEDACTPCMAAGQVRSAHTALNASDDTYVRGQLQTAQTQLCP